MIDNISFNPTAAKAISSLNSGGVTGAADLGKQFGSFLDEALTSLHDQEKKVDGLNQAFIKGDLSITDAHQLTVAAEQALIALETTVQMRNKAIEAYQEIMRMQI